MFFPEFHLDAQTLAMTRRFVLMAAGLFAASGLL